MKHSRIRLTSILLSALLLLGVSVRPAGASEVDLLGNQGHVEQMDELLHSPEYRAWHADALRLYQAFFDREPDLDGAVYWIDKYEDGSTLDDLAWAFSQSIEFTTRYGASLTNSEFLTIVYSNVLGRSPDQDGFDYWLGQMNGGLTQPGVVRWVVANEEFITNYPFTGTGVPIEEALLSPSQVPGFNEVFLPGATPGPHPEVTLTGCDAARQWPKNAGIIGYRINNNSAFYELAYEFSAQESAEAFLETAATVTSICNGRAYHGELMTVADIPVPVIPGATMLAHEFVQTDNQSGGFHWKEVYILWNSTVVVVDISARLPTAITNQTLFELVSAAIDQLNTTYG